MTTLLFLAGLVLGLAFGCGIALWGLTDDSLTNLDDIQRRDV